MPYVTNVSQMIWELFCQNEPLKWFFSIVLPQPYKILLVHALLEPISINIFFIKYSIDWFLCIHVVQACQDHTNGT